MKMRRKFNKFLGMTAVAAATFSLASCQNEFDNYISGGNSSDGIVSLVKTPDVVAWSGQQTLGNTSTVPVAAVGATRAADIDWHYYLKCMDYTNVDWDSMDKTDNFYYLYKNNAPSTSDRGEAVSTQEYNYVMKYLADHPNEGNTECNLRNYFIQNVGSSYATYDLQFIDGSGSVHHTQQATGGNQMDYLVINGFHMGDYNASYGPRALVINNPLQPEISYRDSWGTQDNIKTNKYRFYYIPNEDGNGYSLYLCFDYAVKKYDNGQLDFQGDGVYNDWVIKIVPADGSEIVPPTNTNPDTPEIPETPDTPTDPDNGDDEGDDNGDDNVDETPSTPETPNTPTTPNNPNATNRHGNEVEVNYAILDSHSQYSVADLVTKLSIHVRKATDVVINIPIPSKYLVESDDLYIFDEHYNGVYGGATNLLENQSTSVSYTIYNSDHSVAGVVTLYVDFMGGDSSLGAAFSQGYIRVRTEGIDRNVIDACWNTNQDGINFEVYNYFQTENVVWNDGDEFATVTPTDINRQDLFNAMNNAQISFTSNPDYYINAFGFNDNKDNKHRWHATVTPAASEGYSKRFSMTDHLNGTPYNDIWVSNSVSEVDDYHKH